MALTRPRRLKTLTGAGSVIAAPNDPTATTGIKRAVELAKRPKPKRSPGCLPPIFSTSILPVLRARPAFRSRS